MYRILAELSKNIRLIFRQPIYFIVGILPVFFLTFFFIQGFTFTSGAMNIAVVNYDTDETGTWTSLFLNTLESSNGTIPYFHNVFVDLDEAEQMLQTRETFIVVIIAKNFHKNLSEFKDVSIKAKINNIHEDMSKNIRLGLDARVYEFVQKYQLKTGQKAGIDFSTSLRYEEELKSPDYMLVGVLFLGIMFTSLFYGGYFGANEKTAGTILEIKMARLGPILTKTGKVLSAMILSVCITLILLIFNQLAYSPIISEVKQLFYMILVFIAVSYIFSYLGVSFGTLTGDFRTIPGPMILLSLVLWMLSGAINPLETMAGSNLFQFLPSSAGIRLLVYLLFGRGGEFVNKSWFTILLWMSSIAILHLIEILKAKKQLHE